VFAVAAQLKVRLVDTPVAPSEGDGLEGMPGVDQDAVKISASDPTALITLRS
jgi:hypothetical protein